MTDLKQHKQFLEEESRLNQSSVQFTYFLCFFATTTVTTIAIANSMVSITIIGMRTAETDSGFAFVYNLGSRLGREEIKMDISAHIIRSSV